MRVTASAGGCDTDRAMTSVDEVIGEIRKECADEFRVRLRERLLRQPTEWLVDALLARLDNTRQPQRPAVERRRTSASAHAAALTPHALMSPHDPMLPASAVAVAGPVYETQADRLARAARIEAMCLDEACLHAFIHRCQGLDRDRLEGDGYLVDPPAQGTALIASTCRTSKGDALLGEAKDLLVALLFGDTDAGVRLARVQRELLTVTVARVKADPLACLLRATTEIDVEGTWRDPEQVSDDNRAPNRQIEVEYGEVATEAVGRGIALALRLINDLEINEQILYARMENIEESSLQPQDAGS